MKADQQLSTRVECFKDEVRILPEVLDASRIQQTAARLETLHFVPTLMLPVPCFLYFSKADLLEEIERVAALSEQDIHAQGIEIEQEAHEIKLEQIGLLVYHFKLLSRLRMDEPKAWDEIDELYGDD
jgi:hypothetical protein